MEQLDYGTFESQLIYLQLIVFAVLHLIPREYLPASGAKISSRTGVVICDRW